MFDKKGRWWPSRLADRALQLDWLGLAELGHGSFAVFCGQRPCEFCREMRNLGRVSIV